MEFTEDNYLIKQRKKPDPTPIPSGGCIMNAPKEDGWLWWLPTLTLFLGFLFLCFIVVNNLRN